MTGAQTKLQPTCRAAIVNDFDRAGAAMSMILLQDRTFPKPLDDSGLAGGFQSGPGKCAGVSRPLRGFPRGPGADVQFCARRSDFKGLGFFFCNSSERTRHLLLCVIYEYQLITS